MSDDSINIVKKQFAIPFGFLSVAMSHIQKNPHNLSKHFSHFVGYLITY